jgi:hypothetical protein
MDLKKSAENLKRLPRLSSKNVLGATGGRAGRR